MSEHFQICIREALGMQDASLEELCERIREFRQVEICALSLPIIKDRKEIVNHRYGPQPRLYPW